MEPISREKLLMVITKSNWGGAQSYVYELAKTYANQGHEVMVALGGTGAKGADTGQLAERLRAEQISVHFLRNFSRDVSFFQDFAAFFELVRLTAKIKPDVLHLNSSKAGGVGALAGRLSGVPTIIFTAHGWAHREFRRNFLSRFLIRLSSWATILLSHRVIVVSQLDYTDAPVLCSRKKLELIRNGIDKFELLSREEARQKLSATVPIPSDCTWMLMLAELHSNKGIDVAINALVKIHIHSPQTILVVMGEGQERANLEQLIEKLGLAKHVFLVGFVQESRSYIKAGNLFLMPSRKEGLPFSLLEAGIACMPIAASNVGGIPEVIEDKVTGLLVSVDDVEGFATACSYLLENPAVAAELAQNLHARVLTDFSKKQMIEKTFDLYN